MYTKFKKMNKILRTLDMYLLKDFAFHSNYPGDWIESYKFIILLFYFQKRKKILKIMQTYSEKSAHSFTTEKKHFIH